MPILCCFFVLFISCVQIRSFCSCSSLESALFSCRLDSGVNRFIVMMSCTGDVDSHLSFLFGLTIWFLEDTKIHSFVLPCLLNPCLEIKSLPHVFFVVADVSNSFCRMSVIIRADSSSSKASFSWVSYILHLLQTYSLMLPLLFGNMWEETPLETTLSTILLLFLLRYHQIFIWCESFHKNF